MGTVIKNRGTSCVGVRKTGTTLIHVSTVMGTLYLRWEVRKMVNCVESVAKFVELGVLWGSWVVY